MYDGVNPVAAHWRNGVRGRRALQVLRDPEDPSVFVLYERYADKAGFEAHRASAHFGKWLKGEVLPNLSERAPFFGVPIAE